METFDGVFSAAAIAVECNGKWTDKETMVRERVARLVGVCECMCVGSRVLIVENPGN